MQLRAREINGNGNKAALQTEVRKLERAAERARTWAEAGKVGCGARRKETKRLVEVWKLILQLFRTYQAALESRQGSNGVLHETSF